MAQGSSIEWTEMTWNPVTGCTHISPGCDNCYADRMANRLKAMGTERYRNGFDLTLQPDMVALPRKWKKGRTVFVNSMSDLFHKDVPAEYVGRVFKTMVETPRHQYQVLTKRAKRLKRLAPDLPWPENVWMGVSVEGPSYYHRVDALRDVPAAVRFLSVEPLLEAVPDLNLNGIDWVIVGGESGPGARPMDAGWVREVREACSEAGVAFFFKQWGGTNKKKAGRLLDGKTWDEMPEPVLRWTAQPTGGLAPGWCARL